MVRNAKGFTLIELLIVVVIIGILAAIAIPKFGSTKDKAYVAAMKSDLKNFVLAQESYFADEGQYGSDADVTTAGLFTATTNVTLTTGANTATGFNATTSHVNLTPPGAGETCGVYVGNAAKPDPSLGGEGEVGCW